MSNYIVIKKTETATAYISLCDDGIVRVSLKKNVEIGLNEEKENYETFNVLVQEKYYSFLYTTENSSTVYTSEGLEYAKKHSNTTFPKLCTAVVAKSLAQKIIANFYTSLLNRTIPHKTFTNYNEAEAWCLKMYKTHQNNKTQNQFLIKGNINR